MTSYTLIDHPPDVADARLRELLQYWLSKRRAAPVPALRDIDPVEIPRLLSYLWIHDHDPDTDRFRVRLMGESVRSAYESRVAGVDVETLVTPAAYPVVAERYRAVISIPAIGHGSGRVYGHTIGRVGVGERLYFPLADDDGRIRMLLGATIYQVVPEQGMQDVRSQPDTMSPLTVL